LRALRHVYKWGIERDLVEHNPTENIAKPQPKVKSRDRYLDTDEIRSFWAVSDQIGYPIGPLFQLFLLTGQRESEVGEAVWTEFDLPNRVWNIPAARTKNGKSHTVHLSKLAADIIGTSRKSGNNFVFTTNGRVPFQNYDWGKQRIQRIMGVTSWRPHDIRRTATTAMAELGICMLRTRC
jgi:integrase